MFTYKHMGRFDKIENQHDEREFKSPLVLDLFLLLWMSLTWKGIYKYLYICTTITAFKKREAFLSAALSATTVSNFDYMQQDKTKREKVFFVNGHSYLSEQHLIARST